MSALFLRLCLLPACFSLSTFAADETSAKAHVSDAIKARAAQEAKTGAASAGPAKSPAAAAAAQNEATIPASPNAPAAAAKKELSASEAAKATKQDPTVLPRVEVRKRKLGEFEQQIHNQEAALIREKKNTVPTEMDKALNDSKISKALAIFGGHSGEQRAAAASERVSLMEDEKDLIEAINQAKTKEEKDLLRKQLAEMRKVRRELEKSLK
jgi:hypothetical protein